MTLLTVTYALQEAINILLDELYNFGKHIFHARWSQKCFKSTIEAPVGRIDFAHIYLATSQDAPQSRHWVNQLVTINPTTAFHKCGKCEDTVKQEFVYIMGDFVHDSSAMQTFQAEVGSSRAPQTSSNNNRQQDVLSGVQAI